MWQNLQSDWFLAANQFAQSTPVLHAPMKLYAEYGVGLFAAVLLTAWRWARRDPNPRTMGAALWAPAGALLALGLNQRLVNLAHEPRPYTVFPDVLVLVAHSQDYSFPSDHVVMAFARVYVGAHFPLDVIVGLLLGAAVTGIGYLAVRRLLTWVVTGVDPHTNGAAPDHDRPESGPMMTAIASHMLALPPWVALLVVFAPPAPESSAFIGFVFPGEIGLVLGGVMAFEGNVSLGAVLADGIAGAVVGDSVGYAVGRRYGRRLLDGAVGRFVKSSHLDRAETYLAERRGRAVFSVGSPPRCVS